MCTCCMVCIVRQVVERVWRLSTNFVCSSMRSGGAQAPRASPLALGGQSASPRWRADLAHAYWSASPHLRELANKSGQATRVYAEEADCCSEGGHRQGPGRAGSAASVRGAAAKGGQLRRSPERLPRGGAVRVSRHSRHHGCANRAMIPPHVAQQGIDQTSRSARSLHFDLSPNRGVTRWKGEAGWKAGCNRSRSPSKQKGGAHCHRDDGRRSLRISHTCT